MKIKINWVRIMAFLCLANVVICLIEGEYAHSMILYALAILLSKD